ncbi:hypothetical protein BC940DRAFT_312622 [Gongronella butleri]|nr:hypothetical protein BC940DRAFT_312622 [Gongronella butleri]
MTSRVMGLAIVVGGDHLLVHLFHGSVRARKIDLFVLDLALGDFVAIQQGKTKAFQEFIYRVQQASDKAEQAIVVQIKDAIQQLAQAKGPIIITTEEAAEEAVATQNGEDAVVAKQNAQEAIVTIATEQATKSIASLKTAQTAQKLVDKRRKAVCTRSFPTNHGVATTKNIQSTTSALQMSCAVRDASNRSGLNLIQKANCRCN